MSVITDEISNLLAANGLIVRGGLVLGPDETVSAAPANVAAAAVLLIGQRGAEPWPHFQCWLHAQPGATADPLDTWSRLIIGSVAEQFGARAVSPSDRPYLPFQQWAMQAEGLRPSPLGILMHPEYGLWHAYRGALIFGEGKVADEVRAMNQAPVDPIHLCDLCVEKPCKNACPVKAHASGAFDYQGCLLHVRSAEGGECRTNGCLDRNACPYGVEWSYPADVQAFHMTAFAGL